MNGCFIDILMLHKRVNNPPGPARRGEHVPNFKGDVIERSRAKRQGTLRGTVRGEHGGKTFGVPVRARRYSVTRAASGNAHSKAKPSLLSGAAGGAGLADGGSDDVQA
jgi:hypothetical protein